MESNSEEFYKQKYLKYKHKYLEAQKLYGEELEGGKWGDWIWVICPQVKLDIIKQSWQYKDGNVPDEECLWLQLGKDSWWCTSGNKKLTSCETGKEEKEEAFPGGLGMEEKKGKFFGTNKVYTNEKALEQLNKYKSGSGIFKYKSAPAGRFRRVEFENMEAK